MNGKVEMYEIAHLEALPSKASRPGGKKPPLAWRAGLLLNGRAVPGKVLLKAWEKDAPVVKVGNTVRAERKEYLPADGGRGSVSYMVVGQRAARAAEKEERLEERLATMEHRLDHLEEFVGKLLRERTEADERRAGGNPDARRPKAPQGDGALEAYCRTMADPERKMALAPLAGRA